MGAWGWNPWDNDGAGDMFDDVEQAAWNATRSLLRWSGDNLSSSEKWERVGVVARTVMGLGSIGLTRVDAELCVGWLSDVMDDVTWVASWKEPARLLQAARFWRDFFVTVLHDRPAAQPFDGVRLGVGKVTRPRRRKPRVKRKPKSKKG